MGFLIPNRRRGREILDDASVDAATRIRSIADVARSNLLFGGRRAAIKAVEAAIASRTESPTVLDVGTGLADIPAAIAARARRNGATVTTIGLDEAIDLLRQGSGRVQHRVCGTVRSLPFGDGSIDIVLCSQLLHHFPDDEVGAVIAELDRVARHHVVIADLRRSWLAASGFWLASFPLGFHPITRHDGVASVFRGFTAAELRRAVVNAVGTDPRIDRRLGFRLTASWTPRHTA